jgi:hypothetical protein
MESGEGRFDMPSFSSKALKLTLLGIFLAIVPATWVLAGGQCEVPGIWESNFEKVYGFAIESPGRFKGEQFEGNLLIDRMVEEGGELKMVFRFEGQRGEATLRLHCEGNMATLKGRFSLPGRSGEWVFTKLSNPNAVPIATDSSGTAIKGYDSVAYFTEGRAMKGKKEFAFSWQDIRWYFANAAHRDMFGANPKRYAPQFGGFCAMGMTRGKMFVADPEAWTIVDGKLYIKFNKTTRDRWRPNKAENIKKAEKNWAKITKEN